MKKVLFIALAAAALAACTKTEANYTASQEISFKPVAKYDTKAAVTGTTYGADLPFYVFANAKTDGANYFVSKYFEKVLFVPETDATTTGLQVYKGQQPQYWPNVNPLVFAGLTKSGNIESLAVNDYNSDSRIETADELSKIEVYGYQQPWSVDNAVANDFMYFFADNSNEGYTKDTDYVTPVMNHACSWISVNIKADAALVSYWENLKVTDIHFESLYLCGNVTLRCAREVTAVDPAVNWNVSGEPTTDVKIFVEGKKPTIDFSNAVTATSKTFESVTNNTIVIPQAPAQLSVTYSYTTPAGVENFTETKVIPLDYDGANTAWQPGKHYTYDLTLTAKEIKIAPSSTDWAAGTTDNIAKPF
jgi:hypothetical protein